MQINGKEITTVISDFDGTLIRPGMYAPSEKFLPLVERLLEQGIPFVAASGRQYPNLKKILAPVADRIGFIAENGALVIWQGKVLHKCTIERTLAMDVIDEMKKWDGTELLVSGEATSYIVPHDEQYVHMLREQVKNEVTVLENFGQIEEEILKVSIYFPTGIPQEAEDFFHAKYDDKLLVVESGNGWLDCMPKESGKGNALRVLSEKMGFSLEQAVAFGDSQNDISMLQEVGVAYAMSFARDYVKAVADVTCDSVEEVLEQALEEAKMEENKKEMEEQQALAVQQAMQALENFVQELAERAGESKEYAADLWARISKSTGLLKELAYYYDNRQFWCKYQVAGYTLADVLVWQVDHFKAFLDRPMEMNRYRQERLLLTALDIMQKMEEHPEEYVAKMCNETGTDFVGKY